VIEMALNIRKTEYNDADTVRMVKDIVDFSVISPSVLEQIVDSSDAMNAVVGSSTAMNAVANSSIAMNAIMSGTEKETWWGASYYIGKGLATYATLPHGDLDSLNTLSDVSNDSTAMNDIASSNTAMDVLITSSVAMNIMVGSATAMTAIWGVDNARQKLWTSSIARTAIYNNPAGLTSTTINSDPNLISETELNTDVTAGYFTYLSKAGDTADWTAVNLNDSNKYIAFIHFYSKYTNDWTTGKIASYDQTTNLQTTDGGYSLTRGNLNVTSNGLWVYFVNDYTSGSESTSYARVWYIKV
jgi:hypothetical protein